MSHPLEYRNEEINNFENEGGAYMPEGLDTEITLFDTKTHHKPLERPTRPNYIPLKLKLQALRFELSEIMRRRRSG